MRIRVELVLVTLVASVVTGCAPATGRKQLEAVAKDWCYAIRASQVIPVYPLTEDLRPGDTFLVQTSVQGQADVYRKKGFLALDDLRVRLANAGYEKVYFDSYFEDVFGSAIPNERPSREASGLGGGAVNRSSLLTEANAPRAAFPSYSFQATSTGGLSLALPVKGIPVGLNFLGADKVTGSITIADARTYTGDPGTLYQELDEWAAAHRNELAEAASAVDHTIFLRVVTRVYLTGAVVVSLNSTHTGGASGSGGNAPDVKLINADGTLNEQYDHILEALSEKADLTKAGGSVKFIDVSSRSIGLAESFDRMLAIGYLAFDVAIDQNGGIGAPVPTFAVLEGRLKPLPNKIGELTEEEAGLSVRLGALMGLVPAGSTSYTPEQAESAASALAVLADALDGGAPNRETRALAGTANAMLDAWSGSTSDVDGARVFMQDAEIALLFAFSEMGGSGKEYSRFFRSFDQAYHGSN